MQIAENLVKHGITTGEKFNAKITDFVREKQFTKIIETGTYHGTGTTRAVLNGLEGRKFDFITIEADPENYRIAQQNLKGVEGIHLLLGYTVGKPDLPVSITEDFPDFVVTDHQPQNRFRNYMRELGHKTGYHQLDRALEAFEYKPEFVILDSCGIMGTIEFKYLMDRVKAPFYLALDDTDHSKHFYTMEYIRKHSDRFEIIWEFRGEHNYTYQGDNKDKFGSAIIYVS